MNRPDFDRSCECGYYLCQQCNTPWYPMEIEDSGALWCPNCGGVLLRRRLVRLVNAAEQHGGWDSVQNILRCEGEPTETTAEKQIAGVAANLRLLIHEALACLDRLAEEGDK